MLLITKLRLISDLGSHKGGVWPQMSQSAFPSSSVQRGKEHFQSITHLIIQKSSSGQEELQPRSACFSPLAMVGVKDDCRNSHWTCLGQWSHSTDPSSSSLKSQIEPLKHFSPYLCHLSTCFPTDVPNSWPTNWWPLEKNYSSSSPAPYLQALCPHGTKRKGWHNSDPQLGFPKETLNTWLLSFL